MPDAYDFWAARITSRQAALIDEFWLRFGDIRSRIERHFRGYAPNVNPDAEIAGVLGGLSDDLACDFEVDTHGGLTLVISAELRHSRRPLARAALARGPEFPSWRFSDLRAPIADLSEAVQAIRRRSRADRIELSGIETRRGAHRMIDLGARGNGDGDFLGDQAGIVFSVLLGEEADQDWLGEVVSEPPSSSIRMRSLLRKKADDPTLWLELFRNEATAVIAELREERPERPYAEHRMRVEHMASFRLRPTPGDRARRRDALLYQSRDPKLVAARLAGARISGRRFSRFGEIPCGVKIRRGSPTLAEPEDIASLGMAVEHALMEAGVGGLTGRASGLEHSYLDVALQHLERGIDVLRDVLTEEGIVTPTWLIFDEAGLEDCYHPLMPQTQPTPMDEP
ncbi:MAG: hypothetical protein AAFR79_04150 [Pseudomonadota bacterium]